MARISVERAHGLGKEAAREKADQCHRAFAVAHSDFIGLLRIWRAMPTASDISPFCSRQRLITCTRPSGCRLYSARVSLMHFF